MSPSLEAYVNANLNHLHVRMTQTISWFLPQFLGIIDYLSASVPIVPVTLLVSHYTDTHIEVFSLPLTLTLWLCLFIINKSEYTQNEYRDFGKIPDVYSPDRD
jgi:hypothetical protein